MNLQAVPFTPTHPILKKYISYYYFLKTDPGFESRYYAFPHTFTVLNIHHRASFEISDYYTRVYGDADVDYGACVQGIRELPMLAHLQGALDKVTVLFKPLGINQFGVQGFGSLYPQPSMLFSAWDHAEDYRNFLASFFGSDNTQQRIEVLESFLLQMYCPVSADELIFRTIELLGSFDENISVEKICGALHVNARTLNRAFKKALGVSPAAFRKVARFRHSLENKFIETGIKRLSDIAYQSNYYDPAYFNKMYKSMTGSNPKRFFKTVDSLADNRLIFEFMKN